MVQGICEGLIFNIGPLCIFMAWQPWWGQASSTRLLDHTDLDTPQSVGLFWTSDRPVAETCTWHYTTLTRDRHPWPWRNSNPESQEASGRWPTPYTARPVWADQITANIDRSVVFVFFLIWLCQLLLCCWYLNNNLFIVVTYVWSVYDSIVSTCLVIQFAILEPIRSIALSAP